MLSPLQFRALEHDGARLFEAHRGEQVLGRLRVREGVADYVMVEPEHQRQGIATSLLQRARAELGDVTLSPHRSVEGRPWAAAMERS